MIFPKFFKSPFKSLILWNTSEQVLPITSKCLNYVALPFSNSAINSFSLLHSLYLSPSPVACSPHFHTLIIYATLPRTPLDT